jgi:hypothetical protein
MMAIDVSTAKAFEFAKKYGSPSWTGTPTEIKPLVEDIIGEGFYDWSKKGWVKSPPPRSS